MPKNQTQQKAAYAILGGSVTLLGITALVNTAKTQIDAGNFTYISPTETPTNTSAIIPTLTVSPIPTLANPINNTIPTVPTQKPTAAPLPTVTPTPISVSGYVDGTYKTNFSYFVHGSNDVVEVSLTIQNGIITNYSLNLLSGDPESPSYVNYFYDNSKGSVLNQPLDGNVSNVRVSGASLTSTAFRQAVITIKGNAKK